MKKYLIILGVILGGILLFNSGWRGDDFKIGIVTPERVGIVSISPRREMINLLQTGAEVELWLPEGMGWYPANKIKKISDNEKNPEVIKKMFFYNFGFMPDKVISLDKVEDWRGWALVKEMGILPWIRYKIQEGEWLYKSEQIERSLSLEKEKLDEILPRDFADSELFKEEIKMSVSNSAGADGLGAFVADRLNWMGFNVTEVKTEAVKTGCEVMVGVDAGGLIKKYADIFADNFKCSQISNPALLASEMVLSVGQNYAAMIKYVSYQK